MKSTYTIHTHQHGVYVMEPIPVKDFCALADVWRKQGFTICDSLIANKLGASLAVTNKEDGALWRKELGIE